MQIVHFRRIQNLALLIRPCAHWLRARSVEEQFLVRTRPSPELFLERGKSMLRYQDQGARDAERIWPAGAREVSEWLLGRFAFDGLTQPLPKSK